MRFVYILFIFSLLISCGNTKSIVGDNKGLSYKTQSDSCYTDKQFKELIKLEKHRIKYEYKTSIDSSKNANKRYVDSLNDANKRYRDSLKNSYITQKIIYKFDNKKFKDSISAYKKISLKELDNDRLALKKRFSYLEDSIKADLIKYKKNISYKEKEIKYVEKTKRRGKSVFIWIVLSFFAGFFTHKYYKKIWLLILKLLIKI